MISKRLKSLVKFVNSDDKLIDIGCDHALLDIYLISNGYLNKVIVSDIHEFALQSGIENIKRYELEDKIDARLGNGLEVVNINDKIDTVLISGMGATTILKILDNDYIKNIKKIIIQSNNDHYLLRKSICNLGYKIDNEEYVFDNDKYYINIVFGKGCCDYIEDDYKYGPILKTNGKEYYKHLKNKYVDILDGIPNNSVGRQDILDKIKELDKLI